MLQGTNKKTLLMHASSKVLLLCICFFFPLEKKCFKGQTRTPYACIFQSAFVVHLFLLSLGEEVLQGTNKKPLLMHASSKVLLLCICFFFPLEKNCFKGQIAKHSLLVHTSSKVLFVVHLFLLSLGEELLQGTNSRTLPPCAYILQSAFVVNICLSLAEQVLSRDKRETPAAS